jgi:hypothetical protein
MACALSLIFCCAGAARADVVVAGSTSSNGTGSTRTFPATVANGADRLLAVGISTQANVTVTGVTYGAQALTSRGAQATPAQTGPGAAAEVWTLSAPPVGTANVVVTFSSSVPSVVGATSFTGVDPIAPVKQVAQGGADLGHNAEGLVLSNTVPADGMLGVIAIGNATNNSDLHTNGSVDLVVADQRWNATQGVLGSGATRGGNTGANQAQNAGIQWRWSFQDSQQRNPSADVLVGLQTAGVSVAPGVTTTAASAVTTTTATLGGNVTSDGGGQLTDRGVVYCKGNCTPAIGAGGTTKVAAAAATTGAFSVPATGLDSASAYTVRAYATNNKGTSYGEALAFTTVTPNRVPVADAGGPYSIFEGQGLTLDASGSSDPDNDALTYTWDIDGDGTYGDATGVSPTLTAAQAATLGLGDGPTNATVQVRVSDGTLSSTDTAAVSVHDVEPAATLSNDGPVVEGADATVTFSGASDPSSADTAAGFRYAFDTNHDGTYDVGDGTYAGSSTVDHVTVPTSDDGTITVMGAIVDKDGGVKLYSTTITATNAAPDATLGDDGPVVEGADATVTFSGASDPSGVDTAAGLHYAFDTDGDGLYDVGDGTYGGSPTADHVTVPTTDNGTITVKGAVIDKDGGITTHTTGVVVTNAAPDATLGDDGPLVEGSDATVTFSAASDPSGVDTAAGLHYAFDTDGDGLYDVGDGTYGGSPTADHVTVPTTDNGTITVKGAVIDKDGGVTTHTTGVVVTNAAPTATVTGPTATPRETSLTFTLAATDPSSADAAGTFSYTIDWGDGTTGTVTGPASTTATHSYTAAGGHTIAVVATDKDGGASAPATLAVTIPAAPAPPAPPAAPATTPTPAPVQGASSTPTAIKVEGLSVAPRCVRSSAATTRSVKLRYQLSGAATVQVRLQRAIGSKAVSKCPPLRGSQQDDGHYKAGSYTSVTTKKTTGSSGATSLVIAKGSKGGAVGTIASFKPTALLAKGQKLKAGTYLLTVTVLDANGKAQQTARIKFWVLKG